MIIDTKNRHPKSVSLNYNDSYNWIDISPMTAIKAAVIICIAILISLIIATSLVGTS